MRQESVWCGERTCGRRTLSETGYCQDHGPVIPLPRSPLPAAPAPSLADDVARAMTDGSLRLVHQPKYDARTGEVVGSECLVRWRDARRGDINPATFVPEIEHSEVAAEFTLWTFAEASRAYSRLASPPPSMSVNLSAAALQQPGFGDAIAETVQDEGGDASRIIVEITETADVGDWETALDNAAALREAGFRLSVDDLGAGFATVERLEALAPYEAKVDRSVVIAGGAALAALVARCKAINASVTAEGVEDAETASRLTALGVDTLQGYHLSRPLEERDLAAMLS